MMYLPIVLTLSATASALTTKPLSRQDAETVVDVLSVIEQSYSRGTLIADAQTFDGSLLGALNLEPQVDIVTVSTHQLLDYQQPDDWPLFLTKYQELTSAATNDLASETPFNSTISAEITTLLGDLAGDVSQFLASILAKEPNFDSAPPTRSIVENFVNNNAFATFGYVDALVGLVSEDQTATASAAAAAVSSSYAEALAEIVA